MNFRRLLQVVKYAIKYSRHIKEQGQLNKLSSVKIFFDMISAFLKYRMWTNQYKEEKFHEKSKKERLLIGMKYREAGIKRDRWQREFVENRRFLNKYTLKKYELPRYRAKRTKAYSKQYNMGKNCFVEYGVELTRQHYLPGTITIGDNVLLAKNVNIDYSGNVVIGNNVSIAEGVKILSHEHDYFGLHKEKIEGQKNTFMVNLVIDDNVIIGVRAIIASSVQSIGANSIISAGSVVTQEVPANTIVSGNPAKIKARIPDHIVKIINTNRNLK